uniref:ABC transporter domain-containing protein n=1 Tax=Anopheles dirus TaxID=7168 RepID=A0A182NHJ4_9DIPT
MTSNTPDPYPPLGGAVLLEWKNLSVSVRASSSHQTPSDNHWYGRPGHQRRKEIALLRNASGAVRSDNLVAIMGPSGAGKTTLLAAISMRITGSTTVHGKVLINGLYVTRTQMKQLTGFVPQYEIALQTLTVAEHLTIGKELPASGNPADFYFQLVSPATHVYEANEAEAAIHRYEALRKAHRENIARKCLMTRYHQAQIIQRLANDSNCVCRARQLTILLHRTALDSCRNVREYLTVTAIFLFTSVVIASLYYEVHPVSQTSIQDIRGALFLTISELVYTISYGVFYTFPSELPLIRREVGEKSYSLSVYYLHKVLYSVPRAFFESFLFIGVVFAFVGFTTDIVTYCCMALVSGAASVLAMAYGYLLSCTAGTMSMAIETSNIVFLAFMLLGGLYLNLRAFPLLKYLSFFFFASEGVSVYYWLPLQAIPCNGPSATNETTACLPNGIAVLEDAGYATSYEALYLNYAVMAIEIVLVHLAAYTLLRKFVRKAGFY